MQSPAIAGEGEPDSAAKKLTGNWAGVRDRLSATGLSFDIQYRADGWRNFSGGAATGNRVLDNLDFKVTGDGGKLLGTDGLTLFIHLLNNNGTRPNDLAGSVAGVDNIEVTRRAFKLYAAWAEKSFASGRLSFLLGLRDLNAEFYITDASGLFLMPTCGIGTEMAATGEHGPSVFPNTAMGARLTFRPTDATYLKGAVFDAVPGASGSFFDAPQFRSKEGYLLVSEGGVKSETAGHFAAGAWQYTRKRPELVAPPGSEFSRGIYFLAEKPVYAGYSAQVKAFGRLGFAAGEVEQFSRSWAAGIAAGGFIPSRKNAQAGLAISSAINSFYFRAANPGAGHAETSVELTYRDQFLPWLGLQPDLQYIISPGADPARKNAWLGGLRVIVDF